MKQFVLVDCNNFFVSCQRLFHPALEGKPVLVLSNNDGCVISRSQEVKALGIKMGEPFFKIREFCEAHRVTVFSSNFELYGDLSDRVMTLLTEMAEEIEIYSIDEAFLTFSEDVDLEALCHKIRKTVKKWVGIPTSLGMGPTKTLAKVATAIAKKGEGVADLRCAHKRQKILRDLPIEEIWGIGRGMSRKLHALGIYTAEQLIQSDSYRIRNQCGVVGERILLELQGISCLELESIAPSKSITCSRSFGRVVTEKEEIEQALATYVSRAALKLRRQGQLVRTIHLFLETTRKEGHHIEGATITLPYATDHSSFMISAVKQSVQRLFQEGRSYRKAGITLLDLISSENVVADLFAKEREEPSSAMQVVDAINARFGKEALFFAAMGMKGKRHWQGKGELRTGNYSTDWNQLAVVQA